MPKNETSRPSAIPMERLDVMIKDIQQRIANESEKHKVLHKKLAALNERSIALIHHAASLIAQGNKEQQKD